MSLVSPAFLLAVLGLLSGRRIAALGAGVPTVHVPGYGLFTGSWHRDAGVRLFAGIPYAAAPVGDLRWRPPQPAPSAPSGRVNATAFGAPCPQISSGKVIGSEDCLTLNVYAPRAGEQSRPVLVWLHGGSYVKGTANIGLKHTWGPLYDGTGLAEEGAVVVTVQYRLGVFGFLGSQALRGRDPKASSGNYGLLDQRLALQWVQEHIGAFGGNPKQVLIFGQSAGAGSVEHHLTAPGSRGLFAAASMQSGADAFWNVQSWRASQRKFSSLLRKVNCPDVPCLLRLSTGELVDATQDFSFAATVDGVEVKDYPWRLVQQGKVHKVPLIVGYNRDEAMPGPNQLNMTEADFDTLLKSQGVAQHLRPRVKAEYTAQYTQWYWAAQHFTADYSVACPARRFARAASDAGLPVYAYKFSRPPSFSVELLYGAGCTDSAPPWVWGSYHGAELAFVFGLAEVPSWDVRLSASERQLGKEVSSHWLAMASRGRPSSSWPAYANRKGQQQWLLLDSMGKVVVNEERLLPQCDVVDDVGSLEEGQAEAFEV